MKERMPPRARPLDSQGGPLTGPRGSRHNTQGSRGGGAAPTSRGHQHGGQWPRGAGGERKGTATRPRPKGWHGWAEGPSLASPTALLLWAPEMSPGFNGVGGSIRVSGFGVPVLLTECEGPVAPQEEGPWQEGASPGTAWGTPGTLTPGVALSWVPRWPSPRLPAVEGQRGSSGWTL